MHEASRNPSPDSSPNCTRAQTRRRSVPQHERAEHRASESGQVHIFARSQKPAFPAGMQCSPETPHTKPPAARHTQTGEVWNPRQPESIRNIRERRTAGRKKRDDQPDPMKSVLLFAEVASVLMPSAWVKIKLEVAAVSSAKNKVVMPFSSVAESESAPYAPKRRTAQAAKIRLRASPARV